jgi:hypothetical protein
MMNLWKIPLLLSTIVTKKWIVVLDRISKMIYDSLWEVISRFAVLFTPDQFSSSYQSKWIYFRLCDNSSHPIEVRYDKKAQISHSVHYRVDFVKLLWTNDEDVAQWGGWHFEKRVKNVTNACGICFRNVKTLLGSNYLVVFAVTLNPKSKFQRNLFRICFWFGI